VPRKITEFRISRMAAEHVRGKHGVSEEEALEAAESSQAWRRATDGPGGEKRYLVAGRPASGRRLWVVFADEGLGRGRIVTAREAAGRAEIADHRRMRGD